jgi:uncharacterized protein YndB with AHSA1/START domain
VIPSSEEVLEREIRIAARPETIFPFFTDPAKLVRWQGQHATLDPRPGGIYRVDINGRDVACGTYLEISPYQRIVFSWGWEGDADFVPPGASTVEITLIADGEDTIVRLRHSGLPAAARPLHVEGWTYYLDRLAVAAAGGDAGPDMTSP